jgi:hypothetical protein
VEVQWQHSAIRQRVLGGSASRAAFGVLFRGAQGRGYPAGNGKTMAEKTRKAIHRTAKGKTTNGKPGKRTRGRARATAKPTLKRKKKAQAEAEKKPATANGGKHSSSRRAEPIPGEKHGLQLLKQKAIELIDMQGAQLVAALMEAAKKGNASAARLLFMLIQYSEPEILAVPNGRNFMESILKMANEPEFEHPEEGRQIADIEVGKDDSLEVKAPVQIELGRVLEAELAGVSG